MKKDETKLTTRLLNESYLTFNGSHVLPMMMANPNNTDKDYTVKLTYRQDTKHENMIYVTALLSNKEIFAKEYVELMCEQLMKSDDIDEIIKIKVNQLAHIHRITKTDISVFCSIIY